MPDYKTMYLTLVDTIDKSIELLQSGLQKAEEIYIDEDDSNIIDISNVKKDS